MKNTFKSIFLVITALISSVGCANMQPPPGGPKDESAPQVVAADIANGTTNFTGNSLMLEFSEWVDQRSVIENIFLSPPKEMEFDWSGRDLDITFKEPLDANTTYALTIGAQYSDLSGNKPATSQTIIFSTGSRLDSGIIRGTLTTDNPSGWYILAYKLDGMNPDTLNPATTKPKYRTQAGASGAFELRALPAGTYRVIALKDEFNNGIYDESDAFGTFLKDVTITDGSVSGAVNIRTGMPVDRTPPEFIDAEAVNIHTVRATFSETPDSAWVIPANFMLTDSSGAALNPVRSVIIGLQNPKNVEIKTANPLTETTRWRLSVANLRDVFKNRVSDTARNERFFMGSAEPDTIALKVFSSSISDSTTGFELMPQLDIIFTQGIDRAAFENAATLTRTFTAQRAPVNFTWRADNVVRITPQNRLEGDAWYEFRAPLKGITNVLGNPVQDTTLRLRFQTADVRTYGGIKGVLADSLASGAQYIITLTGKEKKFQRTIVLKSPGAWEFPEVPPGSYMIEAFEDKDGDAKYSYGSLRPFGFAERFTKVTMDIIVKPRWTVENIKIVF